MEKAKIRPLATPKTLNQSSSKLAGVIALWTAPYTQNCTAIGLRVFDFPIRAFDVNSVFFVIWVLQQ